MDLLLFNPSTVTKYNGLLMTNLGLGLLAFNSTFNNISAISLRSVLLVKETGVLGENHRLVTSK